MRANPGSLRETAPPAGQKAPSVRALCLIGFMGAGKSSVGKVLAEKLGWGFEDLDGRIELREKRSIEEIFLDSGEPEFRRLERAALEELLLESGSRPRVIALGGGAFVEPENRRLLEALAASLVFLDAPVEELFRRCQQQRQEQNVERPLSRDWDQFQKLYDARRACYMSVQRRVSTEGKALHAVAEEVVKQLGLALSEPQKH
jgi:shikimate kinase